MERSYDKKYNLRLPNETYDRVEELGRKYDRSVNEQMVYMLKTWQEPSVLEDRLERLEEQVFSPGPRKITGTAGA
jgi:predicted DNA-binding protein